MRTIACTSGIVVIFPFIYARRWSRLSRAPSLSITAQNACSSWRRGRSLGAICSVGRCPNRSSRKDAVCPGSTSPWLSCSSFHQHRTSSLYLSQLGELERTRIPSKIATSIIWSLQYTSQRHRSCCLPASKLPIGRSSRRLWDRNTDTLVR